MNSTPTSDSVEATRLEKLRGQLSSDMEAMHQKEASLREYEQRLRLLVEHAHGDRTQAPTTQQYRFSNGPEQANLDAEWEKYNRAHALLEAARRGLADDRLALREREQQMMIREQEVARRESWVKAREQELARLALPKVKSRPPIANSPFAAARKLLSRRKTA